MGPRQISFEFVDSVPSTREEGKLYISIKYRTAIHNCFCGCGMKVVTPIRPTGWQLIYDGDSVSLRPSVGNWNFDCRSHYWIIRNHAIPAGQMTAEEIEAGRQHDIAAREAYFSQKPAKETPTRKRGFWSRLLGN